MWVLEVRTFLSLSERDNDQGMLMRVGSGPKIKSTVPSFLAWVAVPLAVPLVSSIKVLYHVVVLCSEVYNGTAQLAVTNLVPGAGARVVVETHVATLDMTLMLLLRVYATVHLLCTGFKGYSTCARSF